MMWKIEEILIKRFKLGYAFDYMREHNMFGLHQWDKVSCRTIIYLQERSKK